MKLKLTILIVLLGSVLSVRAQSVPSNIPKTGLVGWWPFSGNANDLSNSKINGTVKNATLTSDRFGNNNQSYYFNGSNSFIEFNNTLGNFGQSNFSISCWVLDTSFSNGGTIFGKRNAIGYGNFINIPWKNSPCIEINQSTSSSTDYFNICSNGTLLNNWHNYVLVRDGNKLLTYIDGKLVRTDNTTIIHNINNNAISTIGARYSSTTPTQFFKGKIDDIGIWNRALTTKEINDISNTNINTNCDLIRKICASVESKSTIDSSVTDWTKLKNFPSSGRYPKPLVINNEGYILGGGTASGTTNELWKYITAKDSWQKMSNAPISANYFNTFTINNIGYAFYDTSLFAYDNSTNSWSRKKGLSYSGQNAWNCNIFVINNIAYMVSYDKRVYAYDPTSNSWSRKSDFPGTARNSFIAVSINGKGYLALGINGSTNICQNDMWEYNPTTDNWTSKSKFPGTARYAAFATTDGSKIYILGGETTSPSGTLKDFYVYDPKTDTYTTNTNFLGGNRNYICGFMLNNTLYCGFGGTGYYNDFYKYGKVISKKYTTYKWSTGDTGLTSCFDPSKYQYVSVTDGNCEDTIYFGWKKETITQVDTIKVNINDTTHISVTDTLYINVTFNSVSGTKSNVVKMYPNPTNTGLTIDFNNYNDILGYSIEIYNQAGQSVYNSTVTQKTISLNLSNWLGKGIYYVKISDKNGKSMDIKKIILQ